MKTPLTELELIISQLNTEEVKLISKTYKILNSPTEKDILTYQKCWQQKKVKIQTDLETWVRIWKSLGYSSAILPVRFQTF